jgi:hypothetical protein
VAELAVRALELSQSLTERWVKANYEAKRTILGIMLESVRLNCEKLEFSLRKPFDLLRDEKLVPLIGASGTPVKLFLAGICGWKPNLGICVKASLGSSLPLR